MKFWEAMKEMERGKRVRCAQWPDGKYIDEFGSDYSDMNRLALMANDEWELYKEPEPTLSFADVVKGLKEGRKFKRKEWSDKNAYIEPNSCQYFPDQKRINNQDGDLCPLWLKDFEATDWIEVK